MNIVMSYINEENVTNRWQGTKKACFIHTFCSCVITLHRKNKHTAQSSTSANIKNTHTAFFGSEQKQFKQSHRTQSVFKKYMVSTHHRGIHILGNCLCKKNGNTLRINLHSELSCTLHILFTTKKIWYQIIESISTIWRKVHISAKYIVSLHISAKYVVTVHTLQWKISLPQFTLH